MADSIQNQLGLANMLEFRQPIGGSDSFLGKIVQPLISLFDMLGLGKGPFAPYGRMAFGAIVAGIIMVSIRPGFAYFPDGTPRPFKFLAGEDPSQATYVPWWMVMIFGAVLCGVFI